MSDAEDPGQGLKVPVIEPMVVDKNPTAQMVTMFVRYVAVAVAGFLMARGLVSEQTRNVLLSPEVINLLVPIVMAAVPTVLGLLKVKRNNAVQQTMAGHLPDAIARVE